MPKYLVQASYTAEGIQGLLKDGASGRKAAVQSTVKALGGKVEAFYYAFGKDDAVIILDLPDNVTAAAVGLTTLGLRSRADADDAAASVEESRKNCTARIRDHAAVCVLLSHRGMKALAAKGETRCCS